jgi:dCMP deaminase
MRTDAEWLREAYRAASFGTDPSTWNGAAIVTPDGKTTVARNSLPFGVEETPERWERPLKYSVVEHAERNAIFFAAYHGMSTRGATMYCPWSACAECARAIIQSGIVRLVGHKSPLHDARPEWAASLAIADEMLREAGVQVDKIEAHFGITIRFGGKEVIV